MSKGYVDAFSRHSAKLRNVQWSFSARSSDGFIVLSCWIDYFVPSKEHGVPDVMRYRDTLQRVSHNAPGSMELRGFLEEARDTGTRFKLIVARPGDARLLTSGRSASHAGNRFDPRVDVVGSLVEFDGDRYVVDFTMVGAARS